MIHVIVINLDHGRFPNLKVMLTHCYNLVGWADGAAAAGAQVTVLQHYVRNLDLHKNGVTYHFIKDYGPELRRRQIPWRIFRLAYDLCRQGIDNNFPTIIHLNGFVFPLQTRVLRLVLPRAVPIVLQHHAARPHRGWKRPLQRFALRGLDGYLFAASQLADEWIEAGVIRSRTRVYEVMEGSSPFRYQERAAARALTGMAGNPILFWAGNLDHNKDPITVLRAFAKLLHAYPDARLYMAFRHAGLLPEVTTLIAQNRQLSHSITLLGCLSRSEIPFYFNSADLFVQGSAKEGSGLALLDALACGVVPVVTDIPPFRVLTDNGRIGALWPIGDVDGCAAALKQILNQPVSAQSRKARDFFRKKWSFAAIGRRATTIYQTILATKGWSLT